MSNQGRRLMFRFILLISVVLLQACTTSAHKTAGMRNLLLHTQYEKALQEAERLLQKTPDGVMENMNVGMLQHLLNNYEASNQAFEVAKQRIEALYATSITEQVGATVVNDELISYQGDRFEQVLIHLYMAKNFLKLGQQDSARVELLQSQVKMNEWGEPSDEVPFMRYFSGIIFELLGEEDSATVSYRKAVDAYRNTYDKHGLNVPLQLKQDLLRMLARMKIWDEYRQYKKQFILSDYQPPRTRGMGELVLIMGNGLAPQREQKVFRTWAPALSLNIKVAIPAYPDPPAVLPRMRVKINDSYHVMETVSNIDGMARAALAENLPEITTRAIARAVAKKKSEKDMGDKQGPLAQFAMMVINQGTEIADTRCWSTLPQAFNLMRIYLPEGEHALDVEVLSAGGHIVDVIKQRVKIASDAKTVISDHWIAPQMRAGSAADEKYLSGSKSLASSVY